MDLPTVHISQEWNNTIVVLSNWLVPHSIVFSRFIFGVACVSTSFCSNCWITFIVRKYHIFCIQHQLMDIVVVSTFRLLQIMLLSICVQVCVCVYAFISLHMVTLFNTFEELLNSFPKWVHHFTIAKAMYEGSSFSASSPIFVLYTFAIILGLRWYLLWLYMHFLNV